MDCGLCALYGAVVDVPSLSQSQWSVITQTVSQWGAFIIIGLVLLLQSTQKLKNLTVQVGLHLCSCFRMVKVFYCIYCLVTAQSTMYFILLIGMKYITTFKYRCSLDKSKRSAWKCALDSHTLCVGQVCLTGITFGATVNKSFIWNIKPEVPPLIP